MTELENNGTRQWDTGREQKRQRRERAGHFCKGRFITNGNVVKVLEALLNPGDRVRTFIEMPPGDVLARLTSKSLPGTRCVAAGSLRVNELEAFSRAIAQGTEC
jgi:hypothetical protein